jgi:hypothetical protein
MTNITIPETPTEAVTLALFLALTAKDQKVSQYLAKEAENIAAHAKLSKLEIGKAKMYARAKFMRGI